MPGMVLALYNFFRSEFRIGHVRVWFLGFFILFFFCGFLFSLSPSLSLSLSVSPFFLLFFFISFLLFLFFSKLHFLPLWISRYGKIRKKERAQKTYVDQRDDTTGLPALNHITVSGFAVMEPPHANPAQVTTAGEVISRIVSKGGDAVSGRAMRKRGVDPRGWTWR